MKYKHEVPEIKIKKLRERPKKNNAHLVPKDKLVLKAYNLELEIVFRKRKINKLPIKKY